MTIIDKKNLLKNRLGDATVEVEGVGTVRVRGLSRQDVLRMRTFEVPDGVDHGLIVERKMLAVGMVDPVLTEDEVAEWQANAPAGEHEAITNKISELSGLDKDAAKEAYKEFEEDPEAEFHVPTS